MASIFNMIVIIHCEMTPMDGQSFQYDGDNCFEMTPMDGQSFEYDKDNSLLNNSNAWIVFTK